MGTEDEMKFSITIIDDVVDYDFWYIPYSQNNLKSQKYGVNEIIKITSLLRF